MRKRRIVLLLSLLTIPFAVRAQIPDSLAIQQMVAILDTLDTPPDFRAEPGEFRQGQGVGVDTLDIQDGRLLLVLRDDHTWSYIKNFEKIAQDSTFTQDWIPNSTNPYKTPLDSLPLRNSICLVDSTSSFVCPNQTKVFSRFGIRRGRRHQGVDLPLRTGTPVYAAFDGRVRASMYSSGYGNLVIIRHENGLETYYGHLSKREVEVGDWVHAGDEIGLGGSTGRSTGPHLHFETRYQGFAFDPEWIADYETGQLRANVFVLRRSYLNANSRYVPESIDEEEEIYATDEQIIEEEKRIAAEQAAIRYHTVKSGDTLSAIAKREGKSINAIKNLNPGLNPDKIRIGQKIRVN
ncbi:MAG: peptidoglycan DD-metalloendopeptidase family protein [Bacteroidales bacterium]|jgi:murein DD-endopeptidase MepM/ murein hydrolase activator NlpD|nr:peptidoglycan DD-metalloendopeptidase family protein [Bacteroidales bacterium]